jgi:hypothetical protein
VNGSTLFLKEPSLARVVTFEIAKYRMSAKQTLVVTAANGSEEPRL